MQKKVSLSFLVAVLFFSFTFVGLGNAKEIKMVPDDGIKRMANELEYIFTEILIKNESTGFYDVNLTELNNSNYTDAEKNALLAYAFIPFGGVQMASNEFTRCLAEALDISQNAVSQLISYIDQGDYFGAATVLGTMGIMINPVVLFVFAMTCGQIRAS
ncbi:hypothetical protein [Solibacillus merdavium]|uniref:Uncharacterized protein n=1 Tax=Solibacillus merdavium TaxID=2762218 RepID=A0ABR8XRV2_9BACL|nr:hypothetical protein [Solibacillus merdavium]MBD8034622.1 hypothetical protein [Solibacillus merdavium]